MKVTYLTLATALACALQSSNAAGQNVQFPPSLNTTDELAIGSGLAMPVEHLPLRSLQRLSTISPSDMDQESPLIERELPLPGSPTSIPPVNPQYQAPNDAGRLPRPEQPAPPVVSFPGTSDQLSVPSCNCQPQVRYSPDCEQCMAESSVAPYSFFANTHNVTLGGWTQFGYHSKNGGLRFNQHADNVNLHQAWLFAERAVDTSGGFDIGGRVDYVYGVDAQDTQAFGINNNHWDNGWDHGIYGHAIPQYYFEVGYGDLTAKIGKFFTIIGNEVVAAPDNFFYSHAYTMYNSEPFTHTGALLTYAASDAVTLYGGYTLGWDSGFEDNGDSFLGGISIQADDSTTVTFATVIGRFGENAGLNGTADEQGYMHSLVLNKALSDRLSYIFQTDYLDTQDGAGNQIRNTRDINQYLIYQLNEKWAVGGRFEWWNFSEDSVGLYGDNPNLAALAALTGPAGSTDVYALTLGVNYRPHANVLIRPEVRWDWVKEDRAILNAADITINENNDASQTTFGIDTIFIF